MKQMTSAGCYCLTARRYRKGVWGMNIGKNIDKSIKMLTTFLGFGIGVYHLLNVGGLLVSSAMTIRVIHLMVLLMIAFLLHPKKKEKLTKTDYITKGLGALVSLFTGVYIIGRWQSIAESGGVTNNNDTIVGIIMIALVLYATYKFLGKALAIIALVFMLYPFIGPYLPGILHSKSYTVTRVFNFLYSTTQGIYGIPMGVSASYIVLFCIFGAFLSEFGVGDFMFKLSRSLTSNLIAGTAKTAVIFSALAGMISGSAAGNVAITGSFTIPMMKKEGYKPHVAAAVEALASTGGQIMPPVMGAAAFIMAEIIGQPYKNIMKAAIIPAILYFLAVYVIVHLTALKGKIDYSEEKAKSDKQPILAVIKEGWYYVIPIAVLIYLLLQGLSPFKAAYYSIFSMLIVYLIAKRDFSLDFVKKIFRSIVEGTYDTVSIAIACAASGIVIGIITLTGVGAKLSNLIITISNGQLLIALVLTMITGIILGMGLPTTAAYLVLASVVAPGLVEMGLSQITAHMFVFFYGCISTITPPVALASYVAAGIAGADVGKVGWTAFLFGLPSYVLPFMFAYGPSLLMQGTAVEIITNLIGGIIGIYAIAASIVGYYKVDLPMAYRIPMFVAGILLIDQGYVTDIIGIAALALLYGLIVLRMRKEKGANV